VFVGFHKGVGHVKTLLFPGTPVKIPAASGKLENGILTVLNAFCLFTLVCAAQWPSRIIHAESLQPLDSENNLTHLVLQK